MWTFYTFPASRRLLCLCFVLFFIIFQRCNLLGLLIGFFSPAPLIAFLSRNIDFCSHCSQPLHLHLRFGSNQSSHVAAKHGMLSLMPKKKRKSSKSWQYRRQPSFSFFFHQKVEYQRAAARCQNDTWPPQNGNFSRQVQIPCANKVADRWRWCTGRSVSSTRQLHSQRYPSDARSHHSTFFSFLSFVSFLFFFFKFYSCAVSRPRYREEHSLPASMREPSGAGRRRKKGEKKSLADVQKRRRSHSTSRRRENVMKTARLFNFSPLSSFVWIAAIFLHGKRGQYFHSFFSFNKQPICFFDAKSFSFSPESYAIYPSTERHRLLVSTFSQWINGHFIQKSMKTCNTRRDFFPWPKIRKKSSMNGSREDEPKWRSNDKGKEKKQIFDTFVWPRDQTMATYSPVHGEDLPSRPLSCCYRPVKWRSATFWALPLASRLVTFTENTALCVAVLLAKCSFTWSLLSSQPNTVKEDFWIKIPPVFAIQMARHFASKTGEAEPTGPARSPVIDPLRIFSFSVSLWISSGRLARGFSLEKILVQPPKNSEKILKISIFLRILNPYSLFGSEQLLEFSV